MTEDKQTNIQQMRKQRRDKSTKRHSQRRDKEAKRQIIDRDTKRQSDKATNRKTNKQKHRE